MPIISNFPSGGAKKTILQIIKEKIVPTKTEQVFTPDEGYDGFDGFTVGAIPDEYHDVSGVNATAAGTLEGTSFVGADGGVINGEMPNNGDVSDSLDGIEVKSVEIPMGYTDGGTISLTDDIDNEVTAQADLLAQIQAALEGKAVEGEGTDTSDATVTAADIIEDKIAYGSTGKITGTLHEISSNSATGFDGTAKYSSSAYGNVINIVTTVNYDVAFRTGSTLTLAANAEEFGNATTDDVPEGKTFTSFSGLKMEGTAPARSYETWVFTLEDGSTVEKEIEVGT